MGKPKIYITRRIPDHLLNPFQNYLDITMWKDDKTPVPTEVLYEEVKKADGLLCLLTENIDQAFLEHASHLKIIANMAVGDDNIDGSAAKEKGIIVTNTPEDRKSTRLNSRHV